MRLFRTTVFLMCAIVLIPASGAGQGFFGNPMGGFRVRGEITAADPLTLVGGLQVQLSEMGSDGHSYTSMASASGTFIIDGVAAGTYEVRVVNNTGRLLHRTLTTVDGMFNDLSIALPQPVGDRPVTGTISVDRLRHRVPHKAAKAFRRAATAADKGDTGEAESQLRQAVQVDPDFYEAHAALGAILLNRGAPRQSLEHFNRAAKLSPNEAEPYEKAAVALYRLGSPDEAEVAARHAITIEENSTLAHLVLGAVLVDQNRALVSALSSLDRAARDYVKAHLVAATAYQKLGQYENAKAELEHYLTLGDVPERDHVQGWLNELRWSHPAPARAGNSERPAETASLAR